MAAMFFEIIQMSLIIFCSPWTEILYTEFQVDRTNGLHVTVFQSYKRNQVGDLRNFFYLTQKNNVMNKFREFGEDISFRLRVIAIQVNGPRLFRTVLRPFKNVS